MVGGIIVQVVKGREDVCVEVLDETTLDRRWRKLLPDVDVQLGDNLWWQSYRGRLSRDGEFKDKDIGDCRPCNSHGRV